MPDIIAGGPGVSPGKALSSGMGRGVRGVAPPGDNRAGERALPGFAPARLPEVTPIPSDVIKSLTAELTDLLGPAAVLSDSGARLSASTDCAHMSPVLEPILPGGVADVGARPR